MDLLIDDISLAALEAIDQAAAEAARAAILTMLERETAALREANKWQLEAEQRRRSGIRNMIITGLACLAGGLIIGFTVR